MCKLQPHNSQRCPDCTSRLLHPTVTPCRPTVRPYSTPLHVRSRVQVDSGRFLGPLSLEGVKGRRWDAGTGDGRVPWRGCGCKPERAPRATRPSRRGRGTAPLPLGLPAAGCAARRPPAAGYAAAPAGVRGRREELREGAVLVFAQTQEPASGGGARLEHSEGLTDRVGFVPCMFWEEASHWATFWQCFYRFGQHTIGHLRVTTVKCGKDVRRGANASSRFGGRCICVRCCGVRLDLFKGPTHQFTQVET
eukprot:891084-Pyramimonas_sp.AAC.1